MRLSTKYFRVRTILVIAPVFTLIIAVFNGLLIMRYLTGEPPREQDLIRAILCITALNILSGFLSMIAYKTYTEKFRNGDRAVWKNSKWRFIKRFLFET